MKENREFRKKLESEAVQKTIKPIRNNFIEQISPLMGTTKEFFLNNNEYHVYEEAKTRLEQLEKNGEFCVGNTNGQKRRKKRRGTTHTFIISVEESLNVITWDISWKGFVMEIRNPRAEYQAQLINRSEQMSRGLSTIPLLENHYDENFDIHSKNEKLKIYFFTSSTNNRLRLSKFPTLHAVQEPL